MDALGPGLWFKREDLAAEPLGGNKVRALEFLLGGVRAGDVVVTVGAEGSTHALATAVYARQLGARAQVIRWPQEMNEVARRVSERIGREADESVRVRTVIGAYAGALAARFRGTKWIPAGGSSPLGILGQVNAGLELADQIRDRAMPKPGRIVVPLGTGGTAAGLALGFAIAQLEIEVIGVRVVPPLVANRFHVRRLIGRTSRLIEQLSRERVRRPGAGAIRLVHDFYGGAYGRVTAAGDDVARRCAEKHGLVIDPTYGAKALAAAVAVARKEGGTTLFWLSFDARWMQQSRSPEDGPVALE